MKTMRNDEAARRVSPGLIAAWLAGVLLLAACGGGSSGSPPSESLSYPSTPLVFTVGAAIAPIKPTVMGPISTFTVSPALPAGLDLGPDGTIAGTPTAVSAAITYTVTGSGGGASASAILSITVNSPPPSSLSYGSPAFTFATGVAARTLTPSSSGGTATSWSIDPALPIGLNFDTTTGAISGTPAATSAQGTYAVTAQNSGGKATVNVAIEVDGGPLLDLGHASSISLLRMSGSSVLSLDDSGHWVLWNYATAAEVASGDLDCTAVCCGDVSNCGCVPDCVATSHIADLVGGTLVLRTKDGFEVRSATTGDVLSDISATATWWTLASDGSYIAAGSSSGLSAWLPSGNSLISLSGDYSKATAFADPGEIQVAEGPSGQNVIQTITIPGGTSTDGPAFNGQFSSWFVDGGHFISTAGTTALVYSQGSVQQAVITLPGTAPVVGQGNWLWTTSAATLDVFAIATGSTPAVSFTIDPLATEIPSGTTLAVTSSSGTWSIIDLSGTTTPTKTDYTLPTGIGASEYAASSTSEWMLGGGSLLLDGASLGGTPRYFDYGAVSSIAGSAGSIAVATSSGRIVYFDAGTLAQEGVISYPASTVLLSSDGSVLAAVGAKQYDHYDVNIYSLPGGTLLYSWPYSLSGSDGNVSGTVPEEISLSGSGAVLAQVTSTLSPSSPSYCTQQANPTTGGSAIFSTTIKDGCGIVLVSPNGTLFATSTGAATSAANPTPGTNILQNGTALTAVTGLPIGWIDDGHLVVNTFSETTGTGGGTTVYAGCNVYSPSGQSTGPCVLPQVTEFQSVTSDTLYAPILGEIVSVSTGAVSWASGDTVSGSRAPMLPGFPQYTGGPPLPSALAGNRVVFESGAKVLAQGY